MNNLAVVYKYFTLREWKIINHALQDIPEGCYVVEDDTITEEEKQNLLVKLPSASFDY